jgi:glucosylglycerate phosphorylase
MYTVKTTSITILPKLIDIMQTASARIESRFVPSPLDQRDSILITYADQFTREGEPPLKTLADVCNFILGDIVSGIHILPFYPFTSDDGFSVSDYHQVKEDYGNWCDITRLGKHHRLMFDAVINHSSVKTRLVPGVFTKSGSL